MPQGVDSAHLSFMHLQGQADRVNYLMTKQAKIVAMTCTHAALKRREFLQLGLKYDNLLMEESAQILEIETFIPMLLQVCELTLHMASLQSMIVVLHTVCSDESLRCSWAASALCCCMGATVVTWVMRIQHVISFGDQLTPAVRATHSLVNTCLEITIYMFLYILFISKDCLVACRGKRMATAG